MSSINCNLQGNCGSSMPKAGTNSLQVAPQEFIDKLKTWLECGAPNN